MGIKPKNRENNEEQIALSQQFELSRQYKGINLDQISAYEPKAGVRNVLLPKTDCCA